MAWLAAGQDSEFPVRSARPDLEAKAADQEHPLPTSGVLSPVRATTVAAQAPPAPVVDDPESAAPRPVIRIVGAPGAHGAKDHIEVTVAGATSPSPAGSTPAP